MAELLRHRGPDQSAVTTLLEGRIGLAFTRLRVRDLSSAGDQPMWNNARDVCLLFNGEIYNYESLRTRLRGRGYSFRSSCDTEAVLHAYSEWGPQALENLEGMFALAVVDLRAGPKLLLARDRAGEKPLYYARTRSGFAFASELKALVAERTTGSFTIDPEALGMYLTLGYIPSPDTILTGVRKLAPGERVIHDVDSESLSSSYFWRAPPVRSPTLDPVAETRRLVEDAVAAREVADVPVGAFLSGGLDSTIVAAVLQQGRDEPLRTFAAGYDVGDRSFKYSVDAEVADEVGAALGTNHTRVTISPADISTERLAKVAYHADEPIANPTMIATEILSEAARDDGVVVLVTGDGSDEVFGGYSRYRAERVVQRLSRLQRLWRLLPGERARQLQRRLCDPPGSAERYASWYLNVGWDEIEAVVPSTSAAQIRQRLGGVIDDRMSRRKAAGAVDALAYLDLTLWVADESNMRVDRMTMAHSVEARAPFQDHHVLEWGMSLPFRTKVGLAGFQSKRLLKEAFADLVPPRVLERTKWGWLSPAHHWVNGHLRRECEELVASIADDELISSSAKGYLQSETLDPLVVWPLMMLALWRDAFKL